MCSKIGRWGAIPLDEIKQGNLNAYINLNDIHIYEKIIQPVVECVGVEDSYLVIKSETFIARIKTEIFQDAAKPKFFNGDKVKFVNSKGLIELGEVVDFYWHMNMKEYLYKIKVNGVVKSKRYKESDLEMQSIG